MSTVREPTSPSADEHRRVAMALLRLVLGCLQMAGAAVALVLLFRDGLTTAVVQLFVATTAITALSLLLFRRQ